MAVSKRTRYEVLRRDSFLCRYCRAEGTQLTVDHVVPVALGGTDAPDNLVAACRDCNAGKAASSPDEATVAQVSDDAVRWAAAMRLAAKKRARSRKAARTYVEKFDEVWRRWHWGEEQHEVPRPADWPISVEAFYTAGLPIEELTDSILIACSRQTLTIDRVWRYMCGIAWNKLADIQKDAAVIFARDL